MWLETSCEFLFEIETPTPFMLMLRPRSGAQQWVAREEYMIEPFVDIFEFTDNFGNLCQRLVAPEGSFKISISAKIQTANKIDRLPGGSFVDIQYLPDSVLIYLLPSRYCESDKFNTMTQEITAGKKPGFDQVEEIEKWIRRTFNYSPGSSHVPLSAAEVNQNSNGVCRDFAHIGIAMCRSISIPARMVVGYLNKLEPMDLHAWFEAFVGGRWYTFDATQAYIRGGYVSIGYGRDAADVAIYNQFGPPVIPIDQKISVVEL